MSDKPRKTILSSFRLDVKLAARLKKVAKKHGKTQVAILEAGLTKILPWFESASK